MISGLDTSSIDVLLAQYRFLEEEPLRNLQSQLDSVNNRISLFDDLKTTLTSLNSLATDLGAIGSLSSFNNKSATSSDEGVVTVSATSSAIASSHTIFVSQLAKSDQVVSSQQTLSGADLSSSLGAGTYTFDVTVDGTTTSMSVDIAAGDDNETVMNSIINAVNANSDAGISASLLKDSETTGRVVFTSEDTGSDFEMTLADTGGTLLSTIGLDDSTLASGTSGGYIYEGSELDAIATIDGIQVTSNSNVLDEVIEGLTFTLNKTQEDGEAPVTVNVNNDVEGITETLQEFVDTYNEVVDFLMTNTSRTMIDGELTSSGEFSGDFSIINLRYDLRSAMSSAVTGLTSGDPTLLSDLGITIESDGKLSISDEGELEEMLSGSIDEVMQLFNSSDGFAARLNSVIETMTDGDGLIELRKDALQSSISILNSRIDRTELSIDRKMDFYADQFAQLQAAYAEFQSQSIYVSQLASTVTF